MSGNSFTNASRRGTKVAETVAREIVRSAAGKPVGSLLDSESVMMERFGVSRGSLREALRLLEVQGLIMLKPGPGGGPVLLGANPESLGRMQSLHLHLLGARYKDVMDARRVLEPKIARMAAERSDREPVRMLEEFLERHSDLEAVDDSEYVPQAQSFHTVVASLSGNPVLNVLVCSLQEIILSRVKTAVFTASERREILSEHANIARAILDGDGDAAEELMALHMTHYGDAAVISNKRVIDQVVDWY